MKEQIISYFERFKTRDTVYEAKGKLFHDLGTAESYAGEEKVTAHTRTEATLLRRVLGWRLDKVTAHTRTEATAKVDKQKTKEKEGE